MSNQLFDEFLVSSPAKTTGAPSPACMNPNDLTIKTQNGDTSAIIFGRRTESINMSGSPNGSSSSSSRGSSGSPTYRERQMSMISANSNLVKEESGNQWSSGVQGLTMPTDENFFADTDMPGLKMDEGFDTSNQQMAPTFDFDTATGTPDGYRLGKVQHVKSQRSRNTNARSHNGIVHPKMAGHAQFFFGDSRETSPFNAMLPGQGQPSWAKHSPSAGLEETFNGITMNGDSPGNATFSPNLQFPGNGFSLETESSSTPSTYTKDISSPPSTVNSMENNPVLTVFPTSLKSRVETQIPIKMTLHPLPPGIKRLKLPRHTVSKPKFLAKPEAGRSADMLELYTSLVCSSAMQDPKKLKRAFARARGEEVGPLSKTNSSSPDGSYSSKDDEDRPLNGGEVKICSGCVQRERKRASRKKQKKPDEEQLFQRDEEKRVEFFNTNEIKEWVDSRDVQNKAQFGVQSTPPPGVVQVELPMRIACYCRHQNEKLGFQVIFTIKDHRDKVIAQAMTNTIMITDDHKTHTPLPSISTPYSDLPRGHQIQGSDGIGSS